MRLLPGVGGRGCYGVTKSGDHHYEVVSNDDLRTCTAASAFTALPHLEIITHRHIV